MIEIKQRIQNYWTLRSQNQFAMRQQEVECGRGEVWREYISLRAPYGKQLQILDVGTGAGFLASIMSLDGHIVTGIDLTPKMLEQAKLLCSQFGLKVNLLEMNAQELSFRSCSFDLIVSRNLTWTLPDVQAAYREWYRVLRPGGVLLNFDADYGKVCFERHSEEYKHTKAYQGLSPETLRECDSIKESLKITSFLRPNWDVTELFSCGFENIFVDVEISQLFYNEKDDFYNPFPMFCIYALKK